MIKILAITGVRYVSVSNCFQVKQSGITRGDKVSCNSLGDKYVQIYAFQYSPITQLAFREIVNCACRVSPLRGKRNLLLFTYAFAYARVYARYTFCRRNAIRSQ